MFLCFVFHPSLSDCRKRRHGLHGAPGLGGPYVDAPGCNVRYKNIYGFVAGQLPFVGVECAIGVHVLPSNTLRLQVLARSQGRVMDVEAGRGS